MADPSHIDLSGAGGYLAAAGLLIAWLARAFTVHRQLVQFQERVLARLEAIEGRQERMSERFFEETRELRREIREHVNTSQRPSGP